MYKYFTYLGHLKDSAAILTNLDCKDLKDLLKKKHLDPLHNRRTKQNTEVQIGGVKRILSWICARRCRRDCTNFSSP